MAIKLLFRWYFDRMRARVVGFFRTKKKSQETVSSAPPQPSGLFLPTPPTTLLLAASPDPTPHSQLPTPQPSTASDSDLSENPFSPITRKNFYKHPIFWARFLGYALPLGFLLYVLYLNYLPFGYHKMFTINVGSPVDTKPSELYLERSKDLSDGKIKSDGTTYRELNGTSSALFRPRVVLTNADVNVEVRGEGDVALIPPRIDFDPNTEKWDYDWDFTNGAPKSLINDNSRAYPNEGGTRFDGTARVQMASSTDLFERGPFTIFAEWIPEDATNDFQEIVGHYNWELLQNMNSVSFRVGRMNTDQGIFYSMSYKIDDPETFFNTKHTCLVSYVPDPQSSNGYIEFYLDNALVDRKPIYADHIFYDYNANLNLTFGKSEHGVANYFSGLIYDVRIANRPILKRTKSFHVSGFAQDHLKIILNADSTSTVYEINVDANQK
jgi:hypothetical protein